MHSKYTPDPESVADYSYDYSNSSFNIDGVEKAITESSYPLIDVQHVTRKSDLVKGIKIYIKYLTWSSNKSKHKFFPGTDEDTYRSALIWALCNK